MIVMLCDSPLCLRKGLILKMKTYSQRFVRRLVFGSVALALGCCLLLNASSVVPIYAAETPDAGLETSHYCADFSAFAERFVHPPFPENASAEDQKNWYALKKTCGRDLIKLSMVKWPAFDLKPEDVDDEAWDKFVTLEELSRFTIAESIFDENHGGTLIKKYYYTDYEPDKILTLSKIAGEQVALVKNAISSLTNEGEWKALRRCELDFFLQDFGRWFAPYCRASLDKLPATETFFSNPDLFLSTADLLEFAVEYIPEDEKFIEVLDGVTALLEEPSAVDIRVFHARHEGSDLISRDEVFKRYCDRIEQIQQKRLFQTIKPELIEGTYFNDRQTELFEHGSLPQWGAKNPEQRDSMYVVFPKDGPADNRPLYVVLHSAGHSARTALDCTLTKGNHDIYTVPDDFYGLFLDCFANRDDDWWWGGRRADQPEINDETKEIATGELMPVEKRLLDEIAWTLTKYKIDANRVYLCGNSMGGSGTLGFGLSNGNVFAAIKANVPAGIWHAYDRLQLGDADPPERIVDPPVCLDYSSPIDGWSKYHEELFNGVEKRKYSYIAYWGNYGHANNDEEVAKYNDLFKTFDWTSIRKDQAYPVFTNASTDSVIPWPDNLENPPAGQRGAYFRWENKTDSTDNFEIELRLASASELKTKLFDVPTESTADVSLRRLQNFKIEPNETISWSFGDQSGKVGASKTGLITIPELTIGVEPIVLKLSK